MAKHKCNDLGRQYEERQDEGKRELVYIVTTCSVCGNVVAKDLDYVVMK